MDFWAARDHASCYGVNLAFARFWGWGVRRARPEMEAGEYFRNELRVESYGLWGDGGSRFLLWGEPGVRPVFGLGGVFAACARNGTRSTFGMPEFPSRTTAGVSFKNDPRSFLQDNCRSFLQDNCRSFLQETAGVSFRTDCRSFLQGDGRIRVSSNNASLSFESS